MEVVKPLIVKDGSSEHQILQVTLTANLETRLGHVRYASIDSKGEETTLHATCAVTFEDGAVWLADWASTAYLIHGRIDTLEERLTKGKADRISRGLAYKMFAALVKYDKPFQGMEIVTLDSSNFEATSLVNFQTTDEDGSFFCSPFWIDSLAHLSGFVLNGSGAVDSMKYVYISHGWKSLRFGRPLNKTTIYRSYVKMQPAPDNVMVGDVFILEEDTIIGVVGGLKFQRIPRTMLNRLLPSDTSVRMNNTADPQTKTPSAHLPVTIANDGPHKPSSPQAIPSKKDTQPQPDLFANALNIISQETDLAKSELLDECLFADLGVDSLLSLQITGKMREEFDLDIPGTVFLDHPTIADFRAFLSQSTSGLSSSISTSPSSTSFNSDDDDSDDGNSDSSVSSCQTPESNISQAPIGTASVVVKMFRETISEQMGVGLEEITGSNDLLSLGMDSLMTLVILGILREQTGLDLPSDLFLQHPSIDAIQEFLKSTTGLDEPQQQKNPKSSHPTEKKNRGIAITPPTPPLEYKAQSILVQGKPKDAAKILFLIPDGSGSATSYANMHTIDPRIAVYALNSPFMTTPKAFTCGIPGIASLYIAEVRRRQPQGPYYLGGWSAGGVIAYEMVRQLLSLGHTVESLILLDSPCPIALEPLPARLHHFFAEIGLLGSSGQDSIPDWLLPHFESSIKALAEYEPEPLINIKGKGSGAPPKTLAIWARYGVCRFPDDPRPKPSETKGEEEDPRSMKWLLENRTDFGANGWDELLGEGRMEMEVLDGNHFSVMQEGGRHVSFPSFLFLNVFMITDLMEFQMRKLATIIRDFLL